MFRAVLGLINPGFCMGIFQPRIVLSPNHMQMIYDMAILIFKYLQMCLCGGLALSSQTVESSFRTLWLVKLARKMIWLETIFWLHPPYKFANSTTILFGNFRQIVL